jgi:hypothetical protein
MFLQFEIYINYVENVIKPLTKHELVPIYTFCDDVKVRSLHTCFLGLPRPRRSIFQRLPDSARGQSISCRITLFVRNFHWKSSDMISNLGITDLLVPTMRPPSITKLPEPNPPTASMSPSLCLHIS